MTDLNRQLGESEEQFIWRIGRAYDSGEINLNWDEIAEVINRQFREDETQYRDSSVYRKAYQSARRFYEAGVFNGLSADEYVKQIQESTRELEKEKIQLRTEKIEYNRWLREDARDEMLAQKFADAIKEAPQIQFPDILPNENDRTLDRSAVLIFGDAHYGVEFSIPGLLGETINEYSPEICEERMRSLLDKSVQLLRREGLSELTVYEIGDSTDGMLRVGQLMKLRYGVVEQSVRYANFLANWLNELSKYVRVRYQMVFGNHTELRFFNQKKGSFKDENVGIFIRELIRARLDGNPNFEMTVNPTGLIFDQIQGYSILGIHGECADMQRALKDFAVTYNTDVDILVGGHTHHLSEETVGIDKEVVSVPSVIGVDEFGISLNKTARPGASMLIIEKDKGITTEHRIKL